MAEDRKLYEARLVEMPDDQFVKESETQCWFSAFANNNPRAPAHWQADMCIDESRRREKPWLFAQGRNKAIRSCGYEPTESDIEAARPKTEATT